MAKLKQEIFAVGKWNGMLFSLADLKSMASSFSKLSEVLKVPLKLGHNDEQPVTDGQPALGWVTDVSVAGDKLVATFDHVPDIMMQAFEAKRYRSVSVELDFNVHHQGQLYDYVLTAVALLGADMPAVNVLNDLGALMSRNGYQPQGDYVASRSANFSSIQGNIQETIMTPEEIAAMQAENAKLKAEVVTSTANFAALETSSKADLTAAQSRIKSLEADQNKQQIDQARTRFTAILEAEVSEKRITPAQREAFAAVLGIDDDEKVLTLDDEKVKAMFAAPSAKDDKETGHHVADDSDKSPSLSLVEKTYDHMAKSGSKDFSASLEVIMRSEPQLARDYINSNGEVTQ